MSDVESPGIKKVNDNRVDPARPTNNKAAGNLPLKNITGLREEIDLAEWSLWRYRSALPFCEPRDSWRHITLGEGFTPLVKVAQFPQLTFKVEYAMPTLSFKDRGAVVLVAQARQSGVDRIAADSSGNAGTAFAAYAARAGLKCDVFVPASASPGKLAQIRMHGAIVHEIAGPRQAATDAALEFVNKSGVFYASHVLNPYFHEGMKTFAFELWEQQHFTVPDHLILPVGHGTLVLGAYKGFKELLAAGYIEKLPVFHAVQASACAPIAEAFAKGSGSVRPVRSSETIAEGIAIAFPPRGEDILDAIKDTKGDVLSCTDEQIRDAHCELARIGFFVEPTAAACFAAYRHIHEERMDSAQTCVLPLCGAGLKSVK